MKKGIAFLVLMMGAVVAFGDAITARGSFVAEHAAVFAGASVKAAENVKSVNDYLRSKGTRAEVEKSTWETMYAREDNELLPFYKTIRKMLPDTVIMLANTPLGGDQNAFTSNYGSDWNYVQQRKNGYALNKCLDKFVKMQNDPKLVFVGTAQAIDPFYGYMRKTHKVNSRCDVTEEVGANAVHPSAEGGLQVGDAMAAAVLWQMGKDLK